MRSDIEAYLSVVKEATAKTICSKIGVPHLDVLREMNKMHAEGVVEREKRKGGGNEYVYWLSSADVPDVAPTGAAKADGGTESAAAVPVDVPGLGELDAAFAELEAELAQASINAQKPEVEQGASTVNAAFEKLCGQTRELLDVLGLPPTMGDAIAAARTMIDIAKGTAIERDELRAEVASQRTANARLKQNNAELESRLDELTLGPIGSKAPLFVTVGRYAKPMRHDSLEKAQKRGKALVRGEKESEVLVLEPVGRIIRGTEWRPQ